MSLFIKLSSLPNICLAKRFFYNINKGLDSGHFPYSYEFCRNNYTNLLKRDGSIVLSFPMFLYTYNKR